MKSSLRLEIPAPCHEDWAKMLPDEKGRHCEQCCKTVVDFTSMSDQEIVRYFREKAGGGVGEGRRSAGVCGRFMAEQLGRELAPAQVQRNGLRGWPLVVAGALTPGEGFNVERQVTIGKATTTGTRVAVHANALVDVDSSRLQDVFVGAVIPETVRDSTPRDNFPPPDTAISEIGDVAIMGNPDPVAIGKVREDSAMGTSRDTAPALVRVFQDAHGEEVDTSQICFTGEPVLCTGSSSDTMSRLKTVIDLTAGLVKDTVAAVVRNIKGDAKEPAAFLHFYPNPVVRGGMLRLLFGGDAGVYLVAIFNMQGQIVQERLFEVGGRGQFDDWPLPSSLAAGMYFVRALRPSGDAATVKVIVQ